VKFKKLAGGGYFKIINRVVPEALRTLGYGEARSRPSSAYAVGHGTLEAPPASTHETLAAKGFTESAEICTLETGLGQMPSTSASSSTSGRWANVLHRGAGLQPRRVEDVTTSTCWRPRLHPPRSTPPTPTAAAP
jgi:ribonucleoside-diphosphate reductase alpha chain